MLTDIQIKNAKPKEKPYSISDFGNLSIVIMPTNHKIWQHRFSIYPNGKRKEKIRRGGQYPTMSIKEARAWRDNNNELLSQGITPPKKYDSIKQVSSDIPTFKEMFDEWHKFKSREWSDNYSIDTQQRADMYLLPQLGKIDIDKIPLGMIRDLLLDIQSTGKHDTVSKIKGIAKQVFDYAVDRDILEINKVLSLSTGLFIKKKEKHYAHAKTPQELKSLLLKIEQVSSGQSVKTALKLVPHLMLRPSEVVGLRWNEIDFDDMLITIPPERMKIKKKLHHVPLSNTTFEILTNLKKNSLDSPYCFPSPKNKSKPIGTESMLRAIRRVGVTADQFVIHGNRHTSATMIANYLPQYSDRVVDAQLHHEIKGVSGIYNRADYLEQRKLLMQDWSNYLDNLQGSKTDSKETLKIDDTIEKLKANINRLARK